MFLPGQGGHFPVVQHKYVPLKIFIRDLVHLLYLATIEKHACQHGLRFVLILNLKQPCLTVKIKGSSLALGNSLGLDFSSLVDYYVRYTNVCICVVCLRQGLQYQGEIKLILQLRIILNFCSSCLHFPSIGLQVCTTRTAYTALHTVFRLEPRLLCMLNEHAIN